MQNNSLCAKVKAILIQKNVQKHIKNDSPNSGMSEKLIASYHTYFFVQHVGHQGMGKQKLSESWSA